MPVRHRGGAVLKRPAKNEATSMKRPAVDSEKEWRSIQLRFVDDVWHYWAVKRAEGDVGNKLIGHYFETLEDMALAISVNICCNIFFRYLNIIMLILSIFSISSI
jgi:hypothetical protein